MSVPGTILGKLGAVVAALEGCGIPYALGGALAYGFHSEPRATFDIDVNVFLPSARAGEAIACLRAAGSEWDQTRSAEQAAADGQARLRLGATCVDLFFADYPFFESCRVRAIGGRIGNVEAQVLSAEDLVVCKVLFNRPKDWIDIRQILLTQGERFDDAYTLHWLDEILGPDDPARERLALEIERARRDLPG